MQMLILYTIASSNPFFEEFLWKPFFWVAFPLIPFALYSAIRSASQGKSMKEKGVLLPLVFLSITLFVFGLTLAHYLG